MSITSSFGIFKKAVTRHYPILKACNGGMSGFSHSAYTFAHECSLSKDAFEPGEVPPGALIHIIKKGLQFIEMEANVCKDGTQAIGEYTFIDSKDLITKGVEELRRDIQTKREGSGKHIRTNSDTERGGASQRTGHGDVPMLDVPQVEDITPERVTTLRGHTAEVFICAWSPTEELLASGSGDSSARIWSLDRDSDPIVLRHLGDEGGEMTSKSKDVTSLDWSPDGTLLATGSYDGLARIWSKTGELLASFRIHQGPIFSLKWNSVGTSLLSGSVDKTAIALDTKTGTVRQSFECHAAAVLDVDWKNYTVFATCSTDHNIFVCEVGADQPVKAFQGHDNEVNAIKWDPRGQLLASCSDDTTARIWSLNQDEPLVVLKGHTKEIYTVKWSPSGSEAAPLLLASASFDATVKLWDLETGKCKHDLAKHALSVYSVAFSPDGKLLASGSFDKKLLIWNVADGRLVKSFTGKGGIYEVCWNRHGTQVAACSNNKIVSVLDIRK